MYWSLIRCTISFIITPETLALFHIYAYPKLESKLITFLDYVFMGVPLLSFKYIHLYINELGFLLILSQYLIIRIVLITDKGNLANSPYIVGLELNP